MSTQIIYLNGWWAEIDYTYTCIEARLYGEMEDCYPEESYFEYRVVVVGIDDEDSHCTKVVLYEALYDEDVVYDLLDKDFLNELPEDYDAEEDWDYD